jgi:hypothetical protein
MGPAAASYQRVPALVIISGCARALHRGADSLPHRRRLRWAEHFAAAAASAELASAYLLAVEDLTTHWRNQLRRDRAIRCRGVGRHRHLARSSMISAR